MPNCATALQVPPAPTERHAEPRWGPLHWPHVLATPGSTHRPFRQPRADHAELTAGSGRARAGLSPTHPSTPTRALPACTCRGGSAGGASAVPVRLRARPGVRAEIAAGVGAAVSAGAPDRATRATATAARARHTTQGTRAAAPGSQQSAHTKQRAQCLHAGRHGGATGPGQRATGDRQGDKATRAGAETRGRSTAAGEPAATRADTRAAAHSIGGRAAIGDAADACIATASAAEIPARVGAQAAAGGQSAAAAARLAGAAGSIGALVAAHHRFQHRLERRGASIQFARQRNASPGAAACRTTRARTATDPVAGPAIAQREPAGATECAGADRPH